MRVREECVKRKRKGGAHRIWRQSQPFRDEEHMIRIPASMDGSIGTLDIGGLRDDDADDSQDELEGEEERQREVSDLKCR